jgi:dihydrofolate synthase/folylpolyglutamate synthase
MADPPRTAAQNRTQERRVELLGELTYAELLHELFPRLTGGIRWGLDRTERLLAAVGNPHQRYPVVHVGGTNGKGSVCATLASVLATAGHRVGLYTSPHLCTFRERIQIDGQPITEEALVSAASVLWGEIGREAPSFFEATTAIAFLALARAEVDVAVIEVGLGGRLDATNVVQPQVTVLTNVALDHVQLLGPTLESVAREKAGILKPGVPAVTAERNSPACLVFQTRAEQVGAPLHVLRADSLSDVQTDVSGTRFRFTRRRGDSLLLHTPLPGRHQAQNAALAAAALELLPESLRPDADALVKGMDSVRWPGRIQIEQARGRTWVFDVAHNVAGAQALASTLAELDLPRPIVSLIGVLGDKDWHGMLGPLYATSDRVVLTLPPTAPPERRWDPVSVLREAPASHASAVPDFSEALLRAWRLTGDGAAGTVLVTGSFHTVGDTLVALGMAPFGADSDLPVPIFAA